MNISAIVSEYNPFHKGHAYHIKKTKELTSSNIIAIMSSNFVQRGDIAVFEKQHRAKMALLNGVDLVLELPVIWSLSCAEKYAFNAVFIANQLGVVNFLSFGSECGNIDLLKNAYYASLCNNINENLKKNLKKGFNFPKAMELAVCNKFGKEVSNILKSPNNILSIEYIKALSTLKSSIIPITVKRNKIAHDEFTNEDSEFCCAAQIRENLFLNKDFRNAVPDCTFKMIKELISINEGPRNINSIQRAILSKLRSLNLQDIVELPEISEGLENRIYSKILKSCNLKDLIFSVKTKRYTLSRIKRIILCAFIGITKNEVNSLPKYVRVLGFNKNGAKILKEAKKVSKIPIITNVKQMQKLNCEAKNIFKTECRATDLYELTAANVKSCGLEMTRKIITV